MTDKPRNPWKTVSSKVAHQNKWWAVRQDEVIRPDGSNGEYNVVTTSGAVMIVAMNDDQEVYLIGQFRYTTSVFSLEVPGGGLGEKQPLDAAQTELKEETGIIAKEWKQLGKFQTSNGLTDEFTYVFLATDLVQTDDHQQSEEGILELRQIPIQKTLSMIKDAEITHAQTIVALTMASLELGLLSHV